MVLEKFSLNNSLSMKVADCNETWMFGCTSVISFKLLG